MRKIFFLLILSCYASVSVMATENGGDLSNSPPRKASSVKRKRDTTNAGETRPSPCRARLLGKTPIKERSRKPKAKVAPDTVTRANNHMAPGGKEREIVTEQVQKIEENVDLKLMVLAQSHQFLTDNLPERVDGVSGEQRASISRLERKCYLLPHIVFYSLEGEVLDEIDFSDQFFWSCKYTAAINIGERTLDLVGVQGSLFGDFGEPDPCPMQHNHSERSFFSAFHDRVLNKITEKKAALTSSHPEKTILVGIILYNSYSSCSHCYRFFGGSLLKKIEEKVGLPIFFCHQGKAPCSRRGRLMRSRCVPPKEYHLSPRCELSPELEGFGKFLQ